MNRRPPISTLTAPLFPYPTLFRSVRPLQQLSRRLAAQHIGASRRHQLVGGVGLPALELLDRQRPLKARHMIGHPAAERRLVKGETRPNRGGAFILLLCIPTHWAFAFAWSRLIFLASDHLWTSVGPS